MNSYKKIEENRCFFYGQERLTRYQRLRLFLAKAFNKAYYNKFVTKFNRRNKRLLNKRLKAGWRWSSFFGGQYYCLFPPAPKQI